MTAPEQDNSLDEATQSEDEGSPPIESGRARAESPAEETESEDERSPKEVDDDDDDDDDEDTDLDDDGLLIQEAEERVETEQNRPSPPPPPAKRPMELPELPKPSKLPRLPPAKPRAAARRPGVTLKRLVDEGFLVPGAGVFRCEYKGMVSLGDLTKDGQILWEGLTFDSPSAWSIHLKRLVTPNRKADDGWKTIKYEGKFLEHFKLALAEKVLGPAAAGLAADAPAAAAGSLPPSALPTARGAGASASGAGNGGPPAARPEGLAEPGHHGGGSGGAWGEGPGESQGGQAGGLAHLCTAEDGAGPALISCSAVAKDDAGGIINAGSAVSSGAALLEQEREQGRSGTLASGGALLEVGVSALAVPETVTAGAANGEHGGLADAENGSCVTQHVNGAAVLSSAGAANNGLGGGADDAGGYSSEDTI